MTEPTSSSAQTEPPRRFGWSRLLLVASLALNLAIAGLILGAFVRGPGDMRHGPGPEFASRDVGYAPFLWALERDERRELGRELRRKAPDWRAERVERNERYQQVLSNLRADPYDPAAMERLMAEQRAALDRRQIGGEEALLDYIARMDPAQRVAFADRLEEIGERMARRGRDERPGAPTKPVD